MRGLSARGKAWEQRSRMPQMRHPAPRLAAVRSPAIGVRGSSVQPTAVEVTSTSAQCTWLTLLFEELSSP